MSDIKTEAQLQRQKVLGQQQEAEETARQQAAEATQQAEVQAEEARQKVALQAAEAQEKARAEALAHQATVRKAQGEAERQAEALKGQARETRRVELRKQDLPFTKPKAEVVNIASYVKSVESERVIAHKEGRSARAEIERIKDDYVAEVDKGLKDAIADIGKQELTIKADIAKQLMEAQANIAQQVAVLLSGVDEWEADAIDKLNKTQADYDKLLGDIAPYKAEDGYDLVAMVQAGYNANTLAVYGFDADAVVQAEKQSKALAEMADYKLPTGEYDLTNAIGKVSNDTLALLFGADAVSSIQQAVTMTAREQFDQWKDTDPTAPKDAVFEGESPDGGFQYSSPSAMTVEVDTAKGKVTMPLAEWDALSDIKKYETVLGRAPTSNEWQAYRLLEAGVKLSWWKELVPGAPDFVGRLAKFTPGTQVEERYVDIKQSAVSEWVTTYPELKWQSIGAGILEDLGFSAAKAIYPQVTIKDVTGKEWAMTGLNVALWTMPAWLPKAIKGGKALFNIKLTTKSLVIKLQSPFWKIDLGLAGTKVKARFPLKVSWGAGLQRAGLSAKIEGIAFDAGNAANDLKIVTTSAKSIKGGLLSPKIASRLKIAQMRSLSADTKFIESLNGLKVTAKQIKLLEQATGYRGLVTPIRNVGIATKSLNVAWDTASKTAKMYGMGSRNYIKSLESITKARAVLGKAVDKLDAILKPRYVEAPSPAKFAGYKMGWTETLDTIVPERPVPKSMIPPSSEGGYGKSGTMSKGFYDQQYDRMIESWHTAQPYEAGSRVATKLQTNLNELAEYRLATVSKLELTAQYVEQLANEVKLAGYPIFSAEQAFSGLLPMTVGQPLSSKQVSVISEALGVSVKEVNSLATQGQLYEALSDQVSQLHATIMELVVMTDVEAVVRAAPEVKGVSDVELAVLSQIALKVATDAMAKNMTAEQVKEATQAAVQSEVKAATKLQVQTITKTAIKTATSIATKFKTQLKLRLAPGEGETKAGKQGKRPVYPDGSIVWLMGELKRGQEWKAILPPYNQNKPISTTKRPKGVTATTGTPQETLTFIGGKTPFRNVAFDLGVTDGYIDVKHKRIEFTGGGLKTNVGTRIPSTTRGITLANSDMIRRLPRGKARRSKVTRQPSRVVIG